MPRYIIFDVDGTLVDSVGMHAEAWQVAFRRYGKEVPLEEVRRQIGRGSDQLLPLFFSEMELESFGAKLRKERSALFMAECMPRVTAFPQVRALFVRLHAEGRTIALASSANRKELKRLKEIAEIADLVDVETCNDDAERSKPHPDIFLAALERLGGPPGRDVIVVGDTPYDAEAAGKIGLRTVGVRCGGWPDADLRKAGCVAVYDDPSDLLDQFVSSPLA